MGGTASMKQILEVTNKLLQACMYERRVIRQGQDVGSRQVRIGTSGTRGSGGSCGKTKNKMSCTALGKAGNPG